MWFLISVCAGEVTEQRQRTLWLPFTQHCSISMRRERSRYTPSIEMREMEVLEVLMEWWCLCEREGNGEMDDNAESHCTESLWPTSHSHPICHRNLFIRHSVGTFSKMCFFIIHVELKWSWWNRDQEVCAHWTHPFFYYNNSTCSFEISSIKWTWDAETAAVLASAVSDKFLMAVTTRAILGLQGPTWSSEYNLQHDVKFYRKPFTLMSGRSWSS